jgi:hypothetical protein
VHQLAHEAHAPLEPIVGRRRRVVHDVVGPRRWLVEESRPARRDAASPRRRSCASWACIARPRSFRARTPLSEARVRCCVAQPRRTSFGSQSSWLFWNSDAQSITSSIGGS